MTLPNENRPQQVKWYKRKGCLIPLIIVLIPVLLICYGFIEIWVESNRSTYYAQGEDFTLDDLPPSAHDVNFAPHGAFNPMGRAYEFSCTEDDYRSWVSSTRKKYPKLSEIRHEEQGYFMSVSKEGVIEQQSSSDILISNWTFEDQGFYLVYDKKEERAICWSHSR